MIGQFKVIADAEKAKKVIDHLTEQVNADVNAGVMDIGDPPQRFSDRILELFKQTHVYSIAPTELIQFAYEFTVKQEGKKVVLTTQESDISAFLKVLIDHGARVEVFSGHDYPEEDR